MSMSRWSILAATFVSLAASSGFAAEKVGEAVLIRTSVTGDGGTLVVRSPVHRDERIRTSSSGLGEFIFNDGTKFAIGWNSSVVIDRFVYSGTKSLKNLTINATKGSFRWISGSSPSSAYKINTPAGTVGIRGTALDIFVGAGGRTAVVLLSGRASFCGSNGCQQLSRRCDAVVATPGGGVSSPERVSPGIFSDLGTSRALPFISGHQRLSGRFSVGGTGCQLSASLEKSGSSRRTRSSREASPPNSPDPDPPDPPSPPDSPDPPDPPDPDPGPPNPPDPPDPPDTPDPPDPPDTPDPPGKGHDCKSHQGKSHHGKSYDGKDRDKGYDGKDRKGKGRHGKGHKGKGSRNGKSGKG